MPINYDFLEACADGDLDEAKALLKQGADIHAWEDETLRWSANEGHLNTVKYLVEQGADIHADDDCALIWAVENGHLDVANYLRGIAGPRYKCHGCLIKSTCLELCRDFRAEEK